MHGNLKSHFSLAGGGNRAFATSLGALRALQHLQTEVLETAHSPKYFADSYGANSGGAWALAAYFGSKSRASGRMLFGQYIPPEIITSKTVGKMDALCALNIPKTHCLSGVLQFICYRVITCRWRPRISYWTEHIKNALVTRLGLSTLGRLGIETPVPGEGIVPSPSALYFVATADSVFDDNRGQVVYSIQRRAGGVTDAVVETEVFWPGSLEVDYLSTSQTLEEVLARTSWAPGQLMSGILTKGPSVLPLSRLGKALMKQMTYTDDLRNLMGFGKGGGRTVMVSDGGSLDNIAILPALRQIKAGMRRIVAWLCNDAGTLNLGDFLEECEGESALKAESQEEERALETLMIEYSRAGKLKGKITNNYAMLFGLTWDGIDGDFTDNQVFRTVDFVQVARGLQDAQDSGNGCVGTFDLQTIANTRWGIPAGKQVRITFVQVGYTKNWEDIVQRSLYSEHLGTPISDRTALQEVVLPIGFDFIRGGPLHKGAHLSCGKQWPAGGWDWTFGKQMSPSCAALFANLAEWIVRTNFLHFDMST
ncbi:hypothetical protein CYMTET_27430 [Cymbomonas tetramitiformis]|uniref:PNPLA domain-containing protein n=1 Tax=Cymbomonas tetramitiformis TaxID=36881 RepID=A0AAE0FQD6_9CHLO|nr:hypothetical protein CYMTET_27430 [Cymbomonas tetramitiformis]|eukprot:gene6134-7358_t